MRLATFNILHGASPEDGAVSAERFGTAVRALDADVLCLQEVDRAQVRSGGLDLTAVAAEALEASSARLQPALLGAFDASPRAARGAGADAAEAAYGVAIVSRVPVLIWQPIPLPASPVRRTVRLPGGRVVLRADLEPRTALAAVLADGPVATVVVAHLTYATGWNVVQLRRLRAACRYLPDPLVLLGDLNLTGTRPARATGWRPLVTENTYPRANPDRQIDHALARGGGLRVSTGRSVALPVSDHRALVLDVEADDSAAGTGFAPPPGAH